MNTRKIQKQAGGLVKNALIVTAGFAAAKIITSKVGAISGNPILAILVPVAGGLLAANMLPKGFGAPVAVGMGVAGAVNAVQTLAPSVANSIGLAGPLQVTYPGSLSVPGVSGYGDVVVE
jgi:hypothetical protein